MTDRSDRILAEAFGMAAQALEEEAALGALLWTVDSRRCYRRQDGADAALTIVGPGSSLRYEVVGVNGDLL